MRPVIQQFLTSATPEALVESVSPVGHTVLLRSSMFDSPQGRYSFVATEPFLTLTAFGSRCELHSAAGSRTQFGDPWQILDGLMSRYELLDEVDLPFPLGGCFGYWGYDLKNFVEPRLPHRAPQELNWPDCHVDFHDSLVAFDHVLGLVWIISTGLGVDGSRTDKQLRRKLDFWEDHLTRCQEAAASPCPRRNPDDFPRTSSVSSTMTRENFVTAVEQAQRYIRAGDIYQVNLSHRLRADWPGTGWDFFKELTAASPARFGAYLDCGGFQVASSSPELFLRLSGSHIVTRPIKGTRPRSSDPVKDAQLTYELQTSPKELSELVMITDLLRNDLGRVCEYGSVHVPELIRLEQYAQVQHLVSTVEGRLRPDVTHFHAFAKCFPGGSISGAPKIRAMEIIDELEPLSRGPYTGALGYLGFNRESQLSILIRAGIIGAGEVHFPVGAGIVADSNPQAEYEETLAKASGFFSVVGKPFAPAISDQEPVSP